MLHKQWRARRNRRGFTLIELLVVVLILAILMAVALPLYLSAVADSETKTCRSNMQTIANAAQAHKVRTRAASYTTDIADLAPDLQATPICPLGGTYAIVTSGTVKDADGNDRTVPSGGFGVTCSAAGHNGFIPGVMGR